MGTLILILTALVSFLPSSPVSGWVSGIAEIPFLNFLNWFIPFDTCLVIMEAYLAIMLIVITFILTKNVVHKATGGKL